MPDDATDFQSIGSKRITSILRSHSVATMRTLEQKISDAGPGHQRVEPLVLTKSRQDLLADGSLLKHNDGISTWYYLTETPDDVWRERLSELQSVHTQVHDTAFAHRLGQALEIAVYRTLREQTDFHTFGAYPDLDDHDDSTLYTKVEPTHELNGMILPGKKRLDFLILDVSRIYAGIEVKNIRKWVYPEHEAFRELFLKCCTLSVVPVLICRRYGYVTYSTFYRCGLLLHQTFNQRYPRADQELAELASHKDLLGYHDIRVGNHPDSRLRRFIHTNLPKLLPGAWERFEQNRDLLCAFAEKQLSMHGLAKALDERGA